jgi:hypothetical protein
MQPVNLGARLELFVDEALMEACNGARLRLHHPQFANVALRFDQPWEGCFVGYPTVIQDGNTVHLYYRGVPCVDGSIPEVTCYAASRDGLTFTRPDLRLYPVEGGLPSNIIRRGAGEGTHNFTPFLDTRPGVVATERFKALGIIAWQGKGALGAFVSADGIRWQAMRSEPVLTQGAFDSQNVAFWSELEGCYLSYFRTWAGASDPTEFKGVRTISRMRSQDFVNWTDFEWMDYGPSKPEELYTNATQPYGRAPHLYLAFPMRLNIGRKTLADDEIAEYRIVPDYAGDVSDGVFMSSRGGRRYTRTFMEAFMRPGRDRANWVSRTNMAAYGMVQTAPDELSLYYQHRYAQPGHYLARYTLRLDGFASLNGPYAGGEMVSRPVIFSGTRLVLNYATSAAGALRIELQDVDGHPLPGYTLDEALTLFGDEIERTYSWKSGSDLAALAGRPVRLRVVLQDADLFSLRFAAPHSSPGTP